MWREIYVCVPYIHIILTVQHPSCLTTQNIAFGAWRVRNGAYLIIIDPEISLLGPQVPLHNCPTFKTYEQLMTDTDKDILNLRHWEKRQRADTNNSVGVIYIITPLAVMSGNHSVWSDLKRTHLLLSGLYLHFSTCVIADTGCSHLLGVYVCTLHRLMPFLT